MDPIKPPSEPVPPPASSNSLASGVADEQQFDRRTAANRRNAQKSTGPRTPEGKKRSASNSTKFGVFSCKALVPGETMRDFELFREELIEALGPATKFQHHLVELYIACSWRKRRLLEMEAFLLERLGLSIRDNQCGPGFALLNSMQQGDSILRVARYNATLFRESVKLLELLRAEQKAHAPLGLTSGNAIEIAAAPAPTDRASG